MPSRDRIPTEELSTPDLDRAALPSDEWPPELGPEYWISFREIGLLRGALRDALSQADLLTFRLRDGSPALNLSPTAFSAAFDRAIPDEIRDSPRNAALLAGLTAWFADISAEIVEYRRPRLEPARAYQRVREENERAGAEREELVARRKAEEAIRWRTHAAEHDQYLKWQAAQRQ
jgi:hypothetical protein